MPIVNFSIPFLNKDGVVHKEPRRDPYSLKLDASGQPIEQFVVDEKTGLVIFDEVKLNGVIVDILLASYSEDRILSGSEKLKRHALAVKVSHASADGEEYSDEELNLIKDLAAKDRPTLVLGRINDAIQLGIERSLREKISKSNPQ